MNRTVAGGGFFSGGGTQETAETTDFREREATKGLKNQYYQPIVAFQSAVSQGRRDKRRCLDDSSMRYHQTTRPTAIGPCPIGLTT
jgi:hypothetical protein